MIAAIISGAIAIVISAIGGAVMWGKLTTRVDQHSRAIQEVKNHCSMNVGQIKLLITEMDAKRESARNEFQAELVKIAHFMGKVETALNNRDKKD